LKVAENQNTSEETLKKLEEDEVKAVRDAAREMITRKKIKDLLRR